MSARAYHRTPSVKLARTIADLAGSEPIQTGHLGGNPLPAEEDGLSMALGRMRSRCHAGERR
jgi:hypothetical protein